jgi:hypothetical protein
MLTYLITLRQPHLAEQFRCAYDCYLQIIFAVNERVESALNRSPLTWLKKGVCAPCTYKTKDEPQLMYSMMAAMDGNNSLKLVDASIHVGKAQADVWESVSPRWLSTLDVDRFKDDVAINEMAGMIQQDWLNAVMQSSESLPAADVPICIERWKNAGPDEKKKKFALFSVSGIFLAVCRHGHVLSICDMIRSGEL